MTRLVALFACLLLAGCPNRLLEQFDTCTLEVNLSTDEAAPGDEISATGGPFSAPFDTTIHVLGRPSVITDVSREACGPCDSCRVENRCLSCGECEACASACAPCEQSMRFIVPQVQAGPALVQVINRHGASPRLTLNILPGPADTDLDTDLDTDVLDTDPDTDVDTDTPDTDIADTDPVDTDPIDTDPVDTDAPPDTDPVDTDLPPDTDPVDTDTAP